MVKIHKSASDFKEVERIGNRCALVHINPIEENGIIVADEIVVRVTEATKGQEIAKLIKANYPSDTMEAIRNNMDAVRDGLVADEKKAEEYRAEYLAMQAWRAKAKEIVEQIIHF